MAKKIVKKTSHNEEKSINKSNFLYESLKDNLDKEIQSLNNNSVEIEAILNQLSTKNLSDSEKQSIEKFFKENEISTQAFETYSKLDSLGRCGPAFANICLEIMPTEEREPINMVHPTAWHSSKYNIVDGESLYNRSHLIAFVLAGENANERNLITGTRFMNATGMNPFENMVADYVLETENHVLYRVTPIFEEDNLLATGVLMEAWSVEDHGDGICFCVFCYIFTMFIHDTQCINNDIAFCFWVKTCDCFKKLALTAARDTGNTEYLTGTSGKGNMIQRHNPLFIHRIQIINNKTNLRILRFRTLNIQRNLLANH